MLLCFEVGDVLLDKLSGHCGTQKILISGKLVEINYVYITFL